MVDDDRPSFTAIEPSEQPATTPRALPHTLRNPFDEELVYLVGGEHKSFDVVHYPRIRRTLMKSLGGRRWSSWDDIHDV